MTKYIPIYGPIEPLIGPGGGDGISNETGLIEGAGLGISPGSGTGGIDGGTSL